MADEGVRGLEEPREMKLYDIIKEFEDLDDAGDVRRWLQDLVKYYKTYHKPAKNFSDGDILIALGGKKRVLPLYRRGMEARKASMFLAKNADRRGKGVGSTRGKI